MSSEQVFRLHGGTAASKIQCHERGQKGAVMPEKTASPTTDSIQIRVRSNADHPWDNSNWIALGVGHRVCIGEHSRNGCRETSILGAENLQCLNRAIGTGQGLVIRRNVDGYKVYFSNAKTDWGLRVEGIIGTVLEPSYGSSGTELTLRPGSSAVAGRLGLRPTWKDEALIRVDAIPNEEGGLRDDVDTIGPNQRLSARTALPDVRDTLSQLFLTGEELGKPGNTPQLLRFCAVVASELHEHPLWGADHRWVEQILQQAVNDAYGYQSTVRVPTLQLAKASSHFDHLQALCPGILPETFAGMGLEVTPDNQFKRQSTLDLARAMRMRGVFADEALREGAWRIALAMLRSSPTHENFREKLEMLKRSHEKVSAMVTEGRETDRHTLKHWQLLRSFLGGPLVDLLAPRGYSHEETRKSLLALGSKAWTPKHGETAWN